MELTSPSPWRKRLAAALFVALLLGSSFLRLIRLPERPFHSDEGVNAGFLLKLMRYNLFMYDPNGYHGPTLVYYALIPAWAGGVLKEGPRQFLLEDWSGVSDSLLRGGIAILGVLLLAGLWACRKLIGVRGALFSVALAGLSCDMLFFSRYFIHEMLLLFLTLGFYISLERYREEKNPSWFYSAVISGCLMFCTKETSLITLAVLAGAVIFSELASVESKRTLSEVCQSLLGNYLDLDYHVSIALCLALAVWFLLYSSFLTNLVGPLDSLKGPIFWSHVARHSGHVKPWGYFAKILAGYEFPIVVFSLFGLVAAGKKKDRVGLFLAFWCVGIFLIYSTIPYKTPWLVINILLPAILLSGYGFEAFGKAVSFHRYGPPALVGVIIAAGLLSAAQFPKTSKVVYTDFNNSKYPQIYVATDPDVFKMLEEIRKAGQGSGKGLDTTINFYTLNYWPLAYYLRDYRRVLYLAPEEIKNATSRPIVAVEDHGTPAPVEGHYGITTYTLHQGVLLDLYISKDLNGKVSDLPIHHHSGL